MSVPAVVPIKREKGYHTDCLGKYGRGNQFMGFVVATLPQGSLPPNWPELKRWYAVLHLFDPGGSHIETRHWYAGVTAEGEYRVTERASQRLKSMIGELEGIRFGDVRIALFKTTIDGSVFGLIDASEPKEGYESVHLIPNELAFFEPWDGLYDT